MPRARSVAKRPAKEWAVRGALALTVAALGFYCTCWTLAQVVVERDVELAAKLAPYDARVMARRAAAIGGDPGAGRTDRRASDQLAQAALRRDPTAIPALVALGLNSDVRGDAKSALRYFSYSENISRRNLPTQLWWIEHEVGRGDVGSALKHYDIALRVSNSTPTLLFPILSSAIPNREVRESLIRTLTKKPLWTTGFVDYIANNGDDLGAKVEIFFNIGRRGVVIPEGAKAALINSLIAKGSYEEAWSYYKNVRAGVNRQYSRDPRFIAAANSAALSQLDWQAVNDGSVNTSVQLSGDHGVVDFTVPVSIGGLLLRQTQLLPAGSYVLRGHSMNVDQRDGLRPYWTLTCLDGRALGRVEVPRSTQAHGNFVGRFDVPSGCPVQYLSLNAMASETVGGISGQIDQAELAPAR